MLRHRNMFQGRGEDRGVRLKLQNWIQRNEFTRTRIAVCIVINHFKPLARGQELRGRPNGNSYMWLVTTEILSSNVPKIHPGIPVRSSTQPINALLSSGSFKHELLKFFHFYYLV